MKHLRSRFSILLLGAGAFSALPAQSGDPRLTNRLDRETREQVTTIIEAARRDGVPTEILVDRALEGASKRATGTIIVSVVRTWADDLRKARAALGPSSTDKEIVAGATALRNGVKVRELERLREARSGVRYAVALDVMNYLVNRGIPADTLSPVIVDLVLASASNEQFVNLQRDVERDLAGGVAPGTAIVVRGEGLEQQIAAASSPNSGAPGSALPSVRGTTRTADPQVNPRAAVGAVQGNATTGASGEGARPGPRGKPKKRP